MVRGDDEASSSGDPVVTHLLDGGEAVGDHTGQAEGEGRAQARETESALVTYVTYDAGEDHTCNLVGSPLV